MAIGRKEITNLIYKRFDGVFEKKDIKIAISIICDELIESLISHDSVSIKNFGTLNPYLFHSHSGINVNSGEIEIHSEFWSVKFHSHYALDKIIEERKDKFEIKST